MPFGYTNQQWQSAKAEVFHILQQRATVRGMISYSDLASMVSSIQIQGHDVRLYKLLEEISTEEDEAGRGMLSVIVVHKVDDMQPGPGFFELANELGRDTTDLLKCWVNELHLVHAQWSI